MSGLTQRQLEMRRTGVTAGDMRAVVGVDPYGRTRHDVYRDKVLGDESFKETEAVRIGHAGEPIALRFGAEKLGLHLLRLDIESLTIRHRERPTHIATPDAWMAPTAFHDPVALGEAKIVGFHNARDWGEGPDEIPDWCLVQVTWQSHVAGIPVVHVMPLIGTEVRTYTIRQSEELTRVLVEEADKFWTDHVLARKPPAVDGTPGSRRMLKGLYPRSPGPIIRATPEIEALARDYLETKKTVKQGHQRLSELEDLMIEACGDNRGVVGEGWRLNYAERAERTVTPAPYTVPAQRHFDLREVNKGLAAVLARKRKTTEAA